MIQPTDLIHKYYKAHPVAEQILLAHNHAVADAAVRIAQRIDATLDIDFIYEAAMLHDIGIYLCDATQIGCRGDAHYMMHGYLGAELLRAEGLPQHAFVAERHTGMGLMPDEVERLDLPLPIDGIYYPMTAEERLICYTDKFFSKKKLHQQKTLEKVENKIRQYGHDSLLRFRAMVKEFGSLD